MTTDELIAQLHAADPSGTARVVVPGYELGVDDVDVVQPVRVRPNAHHGDWEGRLSASSSGHTRPAVLVASTRHMGQATW